MTPQLFKAARVGADLSQVELAKISGVHRRTVCNLESGGTATTPEKREKIKAALATRGVTFTESGVNFASPS